MKTDVWVRQSSWDLFPPPPHTHTLLWLWFSNPIKDWKLKQGIIIAAKEEKYNREIPVFPSSGPQGHGNDGAGPTGTPMGTKPQGLSLNKPSSVAPLSCLNSQYPKLYEGSSVRLNPFSSGCGLRCSLERCDHARRQRRPGLSRCPSPVARIPVCTAVNPNPPSSWIY